MSIAVTCFLKSLGLRMLGGVQPKTDRALGVFDLLGMLGLRANKGAMKKQLERRGDLAGATHPKSKNLLS